MTNLQKWLLIVAVWLITVGIFILVLLNRYAIITSAQGIAYKLDRFTGKVFVIAGTVQKEVIQKDSFIPEPSGDWIDVK